MFSHVFEAGGTNADLYKFLVLSTDAELLLCRNRSDADVRSESASRMLASTRAIVSTYAKPLRDLHPGAGEDGFSIRKLIERDEKRWIFLTARDDQTCIISSR